MIRRSIVFRRSLFDCRPSDDEPICDLLTDVLRRANVGRRVRLLVSTSDRPPAAFGLFRWTIVLPQELIPTLQPDELRALLGHEVAHLARGDAVWLWIGRIACACFAFQPLNFLARGRLRLAAEFLCDDWAVRNSANRFALARCLTRVAEWTAQFSPQPVELAALGSRSSLSERVESLIRNRPCADSWDSGHRLLLVWPAALAIACGLACCAANKFIGGPREPRLARRRSGFAGAEPTGGKGNPGRRARIARPGDARACVGIATRRNPAQESQFARSGRSGCRSASALVAVLLVNDHAAPGRPPVFDVVGRVRTDNVTRAVQTRRVNPRPSRRCRPLVDPPHPVISIGLCEEGSLK